MELLFLGLLGLVVGCVVIGTTAVVSAILALIYAKSYYGFAEATGNRKWNCIRFAWPWNLLRVYLSFEMRYAATNEPVNAMPCNENAIFACHPHGLIPLAPLLAFGALTAPPFPRKNKELPRLHVHRLIFSVPILRDIALWMGFMDVSESTLRSQLQNKHLVALVPAGSRGIIGEEIDEFKHKGFLRIAYECKSDVVPCWTPGEKTIFQTWDLFPRLRRWAVSLTGYPFPTPFIGPLPFKRLVMYVGTPIHPQEFITLEEFQEEYRDQLKKLMQKCK